MSMRMDQEKKGLQQEATSIVDMTGWPSEEIKRVREPLEQQDLWSRKITEAVERALIVQMLRFFGGPMEKLENIREKQEMLWLRKCCRFKFWSFFCDN